MKVETPHDHTLRYWYVAIPMDRKAADRKQCVTALKSIGRKSSYYGLKTEAEAKDIHDHIQKATGWEMAYGKHDYM